MADKPTKAPPSTKTAPTEPAPAPKLNPYLARHVLNVARAVHARELVAKAAAEKEPTTLPPTE